MPPATVVPRPGNARIRPQDYRTRPLGKGPRPGTPLLPSGNRPGRRRGWGRADAKAPPDPAASIPRTARSSQTGKSPPAEPLLRPELEKKAPPLPSFRTREHLAASRERGTGGGSGSAGRKLHLCRLRPGRRGRVRGRMSNKCFKRIVHQSHPSGPNSRHQHHRPVSEPSTPIR